MLGFAKGPTLSEDGYFVDIEAQKTNRKIRFFLPAGVVLSEAFERQRAEALTKAPEGGIEKLIQDLDSDDPKIRDAAVRGLVEKRLSSIDLLENAAAKASSAEVRDRAAAVLKALYPWRGLGGSRLLRDLKLLVLFLSFSEPVAKAARARLTRILPSGASSDLAAWIRRNESRLEWNSEKQIYELKE
jgi:hypothetical protein